MKLVNPDNHLKLVISDKLLNSLEKRGIKHFPNECGGFLIGNYSEDFKTLFISNYVFPNKYTGTPFLFKRSVDGLKEFFTQLFIDKKQYYIGEWHTHPNGSTMYSETDLNAMIEIEQCQTVQIYNPILLILSVNQNQIIDFTFYFYNNKKLTPYARE